MWPRITSLVRSPGVATETQGSESACHVPAARVGPNRPYPGPGAGLTLGPAAPARKAGEHDGRGRGDLKCLWRSGTEELKMHRPGLVTGPVTCVRIILPNQTPNIWRQT